MFRLFAIALLVASTSAFVPAAVRTPSLVARQVLLSEEETQAILQHGMECVESECSVDDVSDLVANLKDQQEILNKRLTNVMNMVAHLQEANRKEDRDEVRSFVHDLLNVFSRDQPLVKPSGLGYTKGPFDSYDVLGVKPWKKPEE